MTDLVSETLGNKKLTYRLNIIGQSTEEVGPQYLQPFRSIRINLNFGRGLQKDTSNALEPKYLIL